MPELAYIRNVTTISLDQTRCNGCRMCMTVCPHPVFETGQRVVEIVQPDLCIECGACVKNCPEGALSVHPGVGCAVAILWGWITRSQPSCGGARPQRGSGATWASQSGEPKDRTDK